MTSSVPNLQQPSNWDYQVDHILPTQGEVEGGDHHPVVHMEGELAPLSSENCQAGLGCCQGVQPPGDPAHLQGGSQQEQGGERDVRQGDGLGAGAG